VNVDGQILDVGNAQRKLVLEFELPDVRGVDGGKDMRFNSLLRHLGFTTKTFDPTISEVSFTSHPNVFEEMPTWRLMTSKIVI